MVSDPSRRSFWPSSSAGLAFVVSATRASSTNTSTRPIKPELFPSLRVARGSLYPGPSQAHVFVVAARSCHHHLQTQEPSLIPFMALFKKSWTAPLPWLEGRGRDGQERRKAAGPPSSEGPDAPRCPSPQRVILNNHKNNDWQLDNGRREREH